jgi:hypothetical protein
MATLATTAKAKLIQGAINTVFGFEPELIISETTAEIKFTDNQKKILRDWIEKQMNKAQPKDIKIDISGILFPIVLKKAFPYLAGSFGLGFFLKK